MSRSTYPAPPSANRLRKRRLLAATILCGLLLRGSRASADGGHIALHASSAAYTITLFTAPDPLVAGPIDLSLLVQDPQSGQVLGNATASATLTAAPATMPATAPTSTPTTAPATLSQPLVVTLTHAAASNKLLLAATPVLPAPGSYTAVIHVRRPGAPDGTFTVRILAAEDHRRRTTLLFALVLPLAAVLLFLVNQWAKQQRSARQPSRPTP